MQKFQINNLRWELSRYTSFVTCTTLHSLYFGRSMNLWSSTLWKTRGRLTFDSFEHARGPQGPVDTDNRLLSYAVRTVTGPLASERALASVRFCQWQRPHGAGKTRGDRRRLVRRNTPHLWDSKNGSASSERLRRGASRSVGLNDHVISLSPPVRSFSLSALSSFPRDFYLFIIIFLSFVKQFFRVLHIN